MQNFLVRCGGEFLLSWDEGQHPQWTIVPSLGAHFTYEDADETAQDLQEIGFESVVTDIFGDAATVEVIQREINRPSERAARIVLATDSEYRDA